MLFSSHRGLARFCNTLFISVAFASSCAADSDSLPSWVPAESPPGVFYQTVDELRSFYKLTEDFRSARKGTYTLAHDDTSIEFGPGARELRINGVDITLSRPLMRNKAGKLLISRDDWVYWIDPVLRPLYLSNRTQVDTVVIDAAHGGHDTGVACAASSEAQITLQVAQALQTELEKNSVQCFLTRTGDYFLSDRQRVDLANKVPNAIFVSLHLNSSNAEKMGPTACILTPSPVDQNERPGNAFACKNAALAYALQYTLSSETQSSGGGCCHTHYSLLSSINMPAVSIELGYASNTKEAVALSSPEYRTRLADALVRGILNYTRATSPAATMPVAPSVPRKITPKKDSSKPKASTPENKPDKASDKRRSRRSNRRR